jgi:hypothetical protein
LTNLRIEELKIEKKAKDKLFKCILCDGEHMIPNDGFSLNILVNKFVTFYYYFIVIFHPRKIYLILKHLKTYLLFTYISTDAIRFHFINHDLEYQN